MRLYVVRHSVREDSDPGPAMEAELTPEGEEIARALGRWMADKEEIPTILITSPSMRTQQTAACIADEIDAAGFAPPPIRTDVSIAPWTSIRWAVLNAVSDASMMRVGIVSHHESIENGLRELRRTSKGKERETSPHLDEMAMCELRILRVKRKSGDWDEHRRILPSDLGFVDHY